jgi:GTP-binding protein
MNKNTSLPIITLVGLPNVGKSSLLNRLTAHRAAIIDDASHTTRDITKHLVTWNNTCLYLQDTPGFAKSKDAITSSAQEQLSNALDTASMIVFVVDATQTKPVEAEKRLARLVRNSGKPSILVINKSDKKSDGCDYRSLGLEHIIEVSAHHGLGVEQLEEAVINLLTEHPRISVEAVEMRVAILGRPNVGKSSLLNHLAGEKAALVSDIAGTTRDPIHINIAYNEKRLEVIDTAGLRKPGKIGRDIEYFSLTRTRQAIAAADVCVLLLDATEPATSQDQRIAGIVREAGKGLILAVNKIDLLDGEDRQSRRLENRLEREFEFVWWAPYVLISTKTGKNVNHLLDQVVEVGNRSRQQLRTKNINDVLHDAIRNQPPAANISLRPKLNYATQTGNLPLTISIYGTHPDAIHFSYRRYLENKFRNSFDLHGVPIKLIFKSKYGNQTEDIGKTT